MGNPAKLNSGLVDLAGDLLTLSDVGGFDYAGLIAEMGNIGGLFHVWGDVNT